MIATIDEPVSKPTDLEFTETEWLWIRVAAALSNLTVDQLLRQAASDE